MARLAARTADPAADRRDRVEQRSSCVKSLRLPPVRTASGVPCPSVIRWCFELAQLLSTGEGPACTPFNADVGGVDHTPGSVQPGSRVQLGQQDLVQPLPHASLVSVPSTRHARPEPEVLGQALPLDPVYSTYKIQHSTAQHSTSRSGNGLRPLRLRRNVGIEANAQLRLIVSGSRYRPSRDADISPCVYCRGRICASCEGAWTDAGAPNAPPLHPGR